MIMAGEGVHLLLLITAGAMNSDSQCPQLPPHCRILSQVSMAGCGIAAVALRHKLFTMAALNCEPDSVNSKFCSSQHRLAWCL